MCILITALLKPKGELSDLKEILERHGKHVTKIDDKEYRDQLSHDEFYCYASANSCDCDTKLGSYLQSDQNRVSLKEIEKLRKKGWSDTKIDRYVKEKEKISSRNSRIAAAYNESQMNEKDDPDGWISISKEIFKLNKYSKIGIIKHWYSKKMDPIILKKENRIELKFDSDLAGRLLRIEEDKCYIISN